MGIPVSGSAERAWANIMASARSIDGTVRGGLAAIPQGISASYARQVYDFACGQVLILNKEKVAPGLNDYAKLVVGSAAYDAVVSIEATVAALEATIDWMRAAWPADSNGLGVQFAFRPSRAGTEDIIFTPESLETFVPLCQALLETLT